MEPGALDGPPSRGPSESALRRQKGTRGKGLCLSMPLWRASLSRSLPWPQTASLFQCPSLSLAGLPLSLPPLTLPPLPSRSGSPSSPSLPRSLRPLSSSGSTRHPGPFSFPVPFPGLSPPLLRRRPLLFRPPPLPPPAHPFRLVLQAQAQTQGAQSIRQGRPGQQLAPYLRGCGAHQAAWTRGDSSSAPPARCAWR